MSKIKMNDMFELPVKVADIRFSGFSHVGSNTDEDNSATIAINAYDADQQEIAELKSQISLIKRLADGLMDSKSGIDYSGKMNGLLDAIDKAPQQCLVNVRADAKLSGATGFKDEMLAASTPMLHPHIEGVFAVYEIKLKEQSNG
jgi:hypothetical protein